MDPVSQIIGKAGDIIDKLVPDKDAARKAKHELQLAQLEGQLAANVEAAKHPSVFVAGARPFCIWALMSVILYAYILHPFLLYLGAFFPEANLAALPRPIEDTSELFYFLGGLLGFSGIRGFEKVRGVARNNLREVVSK